MNTSATAEIIGKVNDIVTETTKGGKEILKLRIAVAPPRWKRDVTEEIIEVQAFGRDVDYVRKDLAIGQAVMISARVDGREYQGKFYVSLSLDRWEVLAAAPAPRRPAAPARTPGADDDTGDVPF